MEFKAIQLSDPQWNQYIESCYSYDFHHTSCFHKIELKAHETAVLLVAAVQNEHVCLPLILKPINNSSFYDATSVYGYCGPVASKPMQELAPKLLTFFKTQFLAYCHKNQIVSVFSRLHSLIHQQGFFKGFGNLILLNKTVAIDLTLPLAEQRKAYRKSNKSEINQLKGKKGYVLQKVDKNDDEKIQEFVEIYHDTMKRVHANSYYFFDFNYFKKLLNNRCFECDLLTVSKENEMAAGAIFTRTNAIMQYHLAGTKENFIQDTPMKLILDEARILGTQKGLKYLHLGGGVGGSDDDSLFRFKAGFSKNFYQFSVWNLIVNQDVYDDLVNQKNLKEEDFPNFFPLYRAGM